MQHPILIIGHRQGIGKALTENLLSQGHSVIGVSRGTSELDHVGLTSLEKDVRDLTADDLPQALSGLVYAPGSINLKPFKSLKEQDFLDDYSINALGAVQACQVAEKALREGKGSVLFFSTVAVGQGMPFHASIAMAKGAIEGLTRSLAAEWAPHVRVNALAPSLTDTPLVSKLLGNEARAQAAAERHPLKQVGRPEDIAALAATLLQSPWMSGEVVGINGGMGRLRV